MGKKILTSDAPELITDPINLDRAIQEIQVALRGIEWLQIVYGRARVIPELVNGKLIEMPKVYYGSKEYLNIFLNDNKKSSAWFQVTGSEIPLDYASGAKIQKYEAPIALIVWFDLKRLQLDHPDFIFTEHLKREIQNKISRYPNLTIVRVWDENAAEIFREYTFDEAKDQFLTYPKGALRFDFLLTYDYDCTL